MAGDTDTWVYESYNLHDLNALASDFKVRFRTKESSASSLNYRRTYPKLKQTLPVCRRQ